MIVVGVLVSDDDDAKSLPIQRPCPIILSSFELYFDFYIDVLLVEIVKNSSKLLALERNGATASFP
jgi:hypothetical protein